MAGWLVTGASGFLGANLGWALGGSTSRIGVSRTAPPSGTFDVHVPVDITDAPSLRPVIESTRPSVIVHAAALSSHETCEADPNLAHTINVTASAHLAAIAADAGSRFIYISTDAVFPGTRGHYVETDETEPFSVYGETKLLGEQAVLDANPASLVVRTNFFGWSPQGFRSILEFFVNALREGKEVSGYTDFVVTSIYAQDLAASLQRLASISSVSGIVHVASRDARSKYEFSQMVATTFNLDGNLVAARSAAGNHSTSRSRDISLDCTYAESLLGAPSPTQAEGLWAACKNERHIRNTWGHG